MREVIYYVAEDGKQFNDEEECKEYELKLFLNEVSDELILLNNNKVLSADQFDECNCIVVRGKQGIEALKAVCDYFGFFDPWTKYHGCSEKPGIYLYDDSEDVWYNLEDKIGYYKKKMNEIKFILGNEFGFETLYK